MNDSEPTQQNRYLAALKNNRVVAFVIAVGIVVIALGKFTDALDSIAAFFGGESEELRKMQVEEYCDLLSPLLVQFDRTLDAILRYQPRDFALEETMRDGNTKARELLMKQRVPTALDSARLKLVKHYDVWLEEYRRVRQIDADSVAAFIFVGPKGWPFPKDAEQLFRKRRDTVLAALGENFACRS